MNKGLLKIALLSMVCASMPAAITSCKDYDDDINTLTDKDQDLQKQISAIQAEIANLKSTAEEAAKNAQQALADAAAAKQTGDDAAAAAAEAKALAELAKQAADSAKADALAAIQEQLKGYVSQSAYDADYQKLQEQLKALDEKIAAIVPGTPGGVTETTFNEAIQGLQTQLDALNKYKELLESLGDQLEVINTLQQTITTINANITALQNGANDFDERLGEIANDVAAIQGQLVTINTDELRALVFNPVFYYHGIEAMWAPTWAYRDLKLEAVDANGENNKFANDAPVAGDSVFMTPDLVATYHMNPSKAEMPTDVKAYSFSNTIKNAQFVRSENVPVPTIYSATVKNGDVTVKANLKDGVLPYIATDGKATVLALEVKLAEDKVITSDYAALKPVYNYGFALANATEKDHQTHWVTTMQEAINKENADFYVAWNSTGVNIAEWVDTHYATDASRALKNDIRWDDNATKNTVREQGFTYLYDLVGYQLGDNKTSESAHAALKVDGNDCWFRPQMTKDGKQQAYGAEQGMASIDRLPIVRVTLRDTVSGKNAAVGYIKVQIVPDTKEDEYTVIPAFVDSLGYTAQCPLQAYDKSLEWWQVEEQIIETLGISKQEFEDQYTPDYVAPQETMAGTTDTYVLKQFDKAGKDAKALDRTKWVGVAGKTENDQASSETNVIRWNITGDQAYDLFVDGKATTTSVTVRFVKTYTVSMGINHSQTVHHYVYVTLTWTPKPLNVTPSGTISDNLKINEMWYEAWTNNHGGFAETHLNVAVPAVNETYSALCTFTSHLLYPWKNEMKLAVSEIDAVYKGYEDVNLTKYFNFDPTLEPKTVTGISGAKYVLTVDGTTLYAALEGTPAVKRPVAVIANNTASYTTWGSDDPTVTYQETAYAKDILNAYSHAQLAKGETVTAKIIITALNKCDKPIALTNNTYNVRFLRPVNMNVADGATMTDALNSGSTIDFGDYLSFTDWRSDDPMSFFSTHRNYYKYYGLQSITVGYINPANPAQLIGANDNEPAVTSGSLRSVITTNLAGGNLDKTTLAEVTPNMDIVYTPATGSLDNYNLGKLTYYNNGENINKAFQIRVPLVLTYKWGYLTGVLNVTINPTIGQQD